MKIIDWIRRRKQAGAEMAWNESGNGKSPWDRGRNEGPPDLDKIVRDLQQRLSGLLGGRRGGSRPAAGPAGAPDGRLLALGALLLLAIWALSGVYRVDEAERGVVLRFGKYERTTLPGLQIRWPWPIERVERVNINEIVPFPLSTTMLTADENIVVVDMVVQYRRADPVKFLFNVFDPEKTLQDISESAIREVIGKNKLDFVLLGGRTEIAAQTEKLVQQTLDDYGTGMLVTKVNLQDTNFPSEVEVAVQDAIKAREDKERVSFEAQAYANDILPKARGEAARRKQDAEAYRARVVANAQGEASRFEQLLEQYQRAPEVTRRRIYIEALEEVYANSNKVLIDTSGSNNVLYLPLDKLVEQRRSAGQAGDDRTSGGAAPVATPPPADDFRERESRRIREGGR